MADEGCADLPTDWRLLGTVHAVAAGCLGLGERASRVAMCAARRVGEGSRRSREEGDRRGGKTSETIEPPMLENVEPPKPAEGGINGA